MPIIDRDLPISPKEKEKSGAQSASAWRLIAIAVGWLLLAMVGAALFGAITGLFGGLFGVMKSPNFQILLRYVGVLGSSGVLFIAAITRGRIVGHGEIRSGLGDEPVSKPTIIAFMAVMLAAYAALPRLIDPGARLYLPPDVSLWLNLSIVFVVAFVTPLPEELFFRGWLWTGLRRHWGILPTALLTSVLWLAMHSMQGILKPVLLLPVAIVLAMARHFGRSVRAPMSVHMIYNLAVAIAPWVLKEVRLI